MAVDSNRRQLIPELFKEIMKNYDERQSLVAPVVVSLAVGKQLTTLRARMNELRVAAEKSLHWNTDKGST